MLEAVHLESHAKACAFAKPLCFFRSPDEILSLELLQK
jgi:hypothetical protein